MSVRNDADNSDDNFLKRMADGEGLPTDPFDARIARMFCLDQWADTPPLMRALARQLRKQADQLEMLATIVERGNKAGTNMLVSEMLSLIKRLPPPSKDCSTAGDDNPRE